MMGNDATGVRSCLRNKRPLVGSAIGILLTVFAFKSSLLQRVLGKEGAMCTLEAML